MINIYAKHFVKDLVNILSKLHRQNRHDKLVGEMLGHGSVSELFVGPQCDQGFSGKIGWQIELWIVEYAIQISILIKKKKTVC